MKKFLRKSLIYSLIFSIFMPTLLAVGVLKAKAASPIIDSYLLNGVQDNVYVNSSTLPVSIHIVADQPVQFNRINILDQSDQVVKYFTQTSLYSTTVDKSWNGKDNSPIPVLVPDGQYRIEVKTENEAAELGDEIISSSIYIDNVEPVVSNVVVTNPINSINQTTVSISALTEPDIRFQFMFYHDDAHYQTDGQDADSGGIVSISDFDIYDLPDGAIEFHYFVTDQAGNSSSDQLIMLTKNTVVPVITLNGDASVLVDQYSEYVDLGATALDDVDLDITSAIVATNDVDTSIPGIYEVKYNVLDTAGNPAIEVIRDVEVVASEIVDLTDLNKVVVILSTATAGTIINIPLGMTGATLDLSDLLVANAVTLSHPIIINLATVAGNVQITIPAGTIITGPLAWDGILNLPQVITDEGKLLAVSPNMVASDILAIEVGLPAETLNFDQAVKIVVPGAADKRIGFVSGGVFTEITQACDNIDLPTTFSVTGECKISSADGIDAVVWTKHFTEFAAYSETLVVNSPTFSVTTSIENNEKFLIIHWVGVGGGVLKYEITVNDIKNYVIANANDLNQIYSFKLKISDFGSYRVLVRAWAQNVYSGNATILIVNFVKPDEVKTITPVVPVAAAPAVFVPSVAPAPAKAAVEPQPEEVKVPSDDSGIIKGEENTNDENEKTNWTPWIILFVLIVLAGAATGGYFYWFAGKDEMDGSSKPVAKTNGANVVVRDKGKPVDGKKTKRW